RVVQLVGDARGQLTHAGQFRRLPELLGRGPDLFVFGTQLGHEFYQLLMALAKRRLGSLPLGDVHDSAVDEGAVAGLDWSEANFDRELAAVLAPAVQVAARPHRAGRGGSEKARAVSGVP